MQDGTRTTSVLDAVARKAIGGKASMRPVSRRTGASPPKKRVYSGSPRGASEIWDSDTTRSPTGW